MENNLGRIRLLSRDTIDKIAAGEVVERPASAVKELVENAIDAQATAVTVEIRDGGSALIRVTDNGCGIPAEDVRNAFLRHATSKITDFHDLDAVGTLGFRGEALASIAAVSRVELITKRRGELSGSRYRIDGGCETALEEIGAPDGTTIFVRSLFYNTPAREKFLRSPSAEASRVGTVMEEMSLSHPEIAFTLLVNGSVRIRTSGSGSLRDTVFALFGKEAALESIPIERAGDLSGIRIRGFLGKPSLSRGSRGYEHCFVNGRYVKNPVLSKAIEDGYGTRLMQHQFPFVCLFFEIDPAKVDVNVHPAKMEIRLSGKEEIASDVRDAVAETLKGEEMIRITSVRESGRQKNGISGRSGDPESAAGTEKREKAETPAEPFESHFREIRETGSYAVRKPETKVPTEVQTEVPPIVPTEEAKEEKPKNFEQLTFGFLDEEKRSERRIVGQVFGTYWIVEMDDSLFLIDQHAAHEKVLYERLIREYEKNEVVSQHLEPPIVIRVNSRERELLEEFNDVFRELGFEVEPFGGSEYRIGAVPYSLSALGDRTLFLELLGSLAGYRRRDDLESYAHRVATEACKAAVKGNMKLSAAEAEHLIGELFSLDDPYHCPHGRPTVIAMTKSDLERRFKRTL